MGQRYLYGVRETTSWEKLRSKIADAKDYGGSATPRATLSPDEFMGAAGLSWREILASLTTNPAQRFGETASRGHVAEGQVADLVVLGSDPVRGSRAFADVRWTIRGGQVIYEGRTASR